MTSYTTTIEGANNGAVFTATYAYNADGERVLQRNSDAEIFYVGSYHEKDMTHNVRTTYYTFGGQRVGMRQGSDAHQRGGVLAAQRPSGFVQLVNRSGWRVGE